MKIIRGIYKGRIIKGFTILGTRPTMDRVKESIFSMIQDKLEESIVLDLFSGSGNYGIEALSSNAKYVYFNDLNKEACKVISTNLKELGVNNNSYQILNLDYLKCLNKLKDSKFDLIFLDPPYKLDVLNNILDYISRNNLLNKGGLVIVEYQFDKLNDKYVNLELIKEKKYGEKRVFIYENK